ncbi:unnamed protein product [Adineta steineri]|uniref:G-protein coupled receptors family 1 profile domain-containing protein n=1 Tax=Adineta steineri TaxID=433720 RepID=A0A813UDJ4_9BILA|nr:unnamed protein product [Adineta steineri]
MTTNSTPLVTVGYMINETTQVSKTSHYLFIIHYLSIYALVLIIIGTVGNLLTIIVLLRRHLRRFVTVRWLIAVSICDIISLYGWNLNNFYKFNVSSRNSNIEDISLFHCRFISYMTFVALQLSSWCLTAVSLDRALNLYWPQWKRLYGRIRYTKYYIMVLTTICLALNSHILFLNGYRTSTGIITCYSTRSNPDYIYPQWERVHLVLYNLCPFAIMLICNTYIIFVTVRSSRTQQTELTPAKLQRKSLERYRQFTALLIIVTFAFVLLTLPACIYFVFFRNYFVTKAHRTYRFMVQIFLNSIQFTSHGINFFLYCFSAKSFRHELHGMFRELLTSCQCKCRLSLKDNRQHDHIRQYINNNNNNIEPIIQHQQLLYNRDMQMNRYKFNFFPEFKSTSDKNPNWV